MPGFLASFWPLFGFNIQKFWYSFEECHCAGRGNPGGILRRNGVEAAHFVHFDSPICDDTYTVLPESL